MDLVFWLTMTVYAWYAVGHHERQYKAWKLGKELQQEIEIYERTGGK